jgi:CheY-like chemotaxis protein
MSAKRILIVDDDPALLKMLEDGLELYFADCQVECASDGRAALRRLARQRFDRILTDYDMPGLNGLELALIVRQVLPHTRIVLMTALGDSRELLDGICALDLNGYVEKPFSLKRVREVLWASLEGASKEEEFPQGRLGPQ